MNSPSCHITWTPLFLWYSLDCQTSLFFQNMFYFLNHFSQRHSFVESIAVVTACWSSEIETQVHKRSESVWIALGLVMLRLFFGIRFNLSKLHTVHHGELVFSRFRRLAMAFFVWVELCVQNSLLWQPTRLLLAGTISIWQQAPCLVDKKCPKRSWRWISNGSGMRNDNSL